MHGANLVMRSMCWLMVGHLLSQHPQDNKTLCMRQSCAYVYIHTYPQPRDSHALGESCAAVYAVYVLADSRTSCCLNTHKILISYACDNLVLMYTYIHISPQPKDRYAWGAPCADSRTSSLSSSFQTIAKSFSAPTKSTKRKKNSEEKKTLRP